MISSAVTSATKAAHSAVVSLASATQISVGSPVPDVSVKVNSPTETLNFSTLPGKNVIVVVPAAFSPSCSEIQVPEYIGRFKEFEQKGVKGVYVVSVNDIFVMKAWKKDLVAKAEGGDSQVVFGESPESSGLFVLPSILFLFSDEFGGKCLLIHFNFSLLASHLSPLTSFISFHTSHFSPLTSYSVFGACGARNTCSRRRHRLVRIRHRTRVRRFLLVGRSEGQEGRHRYRQYRVANTTMAILGLPNDHKERTRSLILILLFSISVSSFPCSRLVPPTCWSSTSIARWTRLTSRPFPYCTTLFLHSAISLLPSIPLDVDIPTPISRHPQSPIPKK